MSAVRVLLLLCLASAGLAACDVASPDDVEIGALEVVFGCAFVDNEVLTIGATRTALIGQATFRAVEPCLLGDLQGGRLAFERDDARRAVDLYALRVPARSAVRLVGRTDEFFGTIAVFREDGALVASASLDDLDDNGRYRGGLTRTLDPGLYVVGMVTLDGTGRYTIRTEASADDLALRLDCPNPTVSLLDIGQVTPFGFSEVDCTAGGVEPATSFDEAETSYVKYFQASYEGGDLTVGIQRNASGGAASCPVLTLLDSDGQIVRSQTEISNGCSFARIFAVDQGVYTARVSGTFEPTQPNAYSITIGK